MIHRMLLFACIIFALHSCKTDDENPPYNKDGVLASGTQMLQYDGETREYIIYLPDSYNSNKSHPLLLSFHGFGGNANEFIQYADFRSLAESENFILVVPQGTELDGFSHWNAALKSSSNKSDADDLGFIEALIGKLSNDYAIDSKRIYACGFSNGGMFSYALACYKSDLVAAVGSISGALLDTNCTSIIPKPIIAIHGTDDFVIPYNGNSDYRSVDAAINYWVSFNNTNTTAIKSTANSNGITIEHFLYDQGENGVSVEHYKILKGGHEWFKLNYQGANTEKLIWDFFKQYDIDGKK